MTKAKNPFEAFNQVEPFSVKSTPQNMCYKVDVDDEFEHPRQFSEIVEVLDNASEGDYMEISLTTIGGALNSVLPLLGAIETTACHVHVNAVSDIASAGTFLLMKAHSISVNDHVTIMFHNVSFGSGGSGHTVATHVAHTLKSSEKILRDMYSMFFSEEEMKQMLTGTDFYMDKEQFIARYENRMKLQQARLESITAELEGRALVDSKPKRVKKPKIDTVIQAITVDNSEVK